MLHCPNYNVAKTQNRRCWLTWANPNLNAIYKLLLGSTNTTCSVTRNNGCLWRKNSL